MIGYSIMVPRALEVFRILSREGIEVEIVDIRSLRLLDTDTIARSVKKPTG